MIMIRKALVSEETNIGHIGRRDDVDARDSCEMSSHLPKKR